MARLTGFEPVTYGLEVRCSIHLSYRRNHNHIHDDQLSQELIVVNKNSDGQMLILLIHSTQSFNIHKNVFFAIF